MAPEGTTLADAPVEYVEAAEFGPGEGNVAPMGVLDVVFTDKGDTSNPLFRAERVGDVVEMDEADPADE